MNQTAERQEVKTVLDREFHELISNFPGCLRGLYKEQMDIHNEDARKHFLEYCDSNKCIRGKDFVVSALNKGWHEGVCLECAFNPYNFCVEDQEV